MSYGLEALEYIRNIVVEDNIESDYQHCLNEYDCYKRPCDTIERELKALEIIKNKEVNVNTLINCIIGAIEPLEFYNEKVSENLMLTQHEFDLLREVLENERNTSKI